ncbi:MAG TPA: M20/M25/M40 family metallo-hydrolase [Anaeromyxobacteraceae bacterium]|nr:M20/M25/M40 family metallo-hydrolase [Anaeromyxobacteraceae bacterium]
MFQRKDRLDPSRRYRLCAEVARAAVAPLPGPSSSRSSSRFAATLGVALASALAACSGVQTAAQKSPEARIRAGDAAEAVRWLADPARTGRAIGTPGNAAAADWIAREMEKAGLAPAGTDGWMQPFEAPVQAVLRGDNALRLGGDDAPLHAAWQPFTFSDDGQVEGELVWAGYGITAPALGWDDYAGLDVKGKIVVVAAHFPGEPDEKSPFRSPDAFHYGEWRTKAANAREHGAAAMLAVRDDWHHPGPDTLPPWKGTVSARSGIVAAQVTAAALQRAGIDAAALAAATDEHRRPHSAPTGVSARLVVGLEQERATTANVVGALHGTDPDAGCVVVGAHYDHLGYGGETSLAPDVRAVHPGADDNASGVAALLGIARAFVAEGPPRRTVVFAAFTGEESGLLGSSHFVKSPPRGCRPEQTQLRVNLDMVGRPQRGKVYVNGAQTAKGLREWVESVAAGSPKLPLTIAWGSGDGYGPSDQTSFYAKGVPVLFFFTGAHGDYHRPSDTADKVDAEGLAAVARLAYRAASFAANSPERLEVVRVAAPPSGERGGRGYGAYLGTIPDFEERKEPGVAITGVRPGSPAEKAGLAAGDVLHRIGGTTIVSLADVAVALRSHRPGDTVEVEYARGAKRETVKVTLAERK